MKKLVQLLFIICYLFIYVFIYFYSFCRQKKKRFFKCVILVLATRGGSA